MSVIRAIREGKSIPCFTLLLAFFLVTRLALLLHSELARVHLEELYLGVIGHDMLNGLIMPLWEYPYHPYDAGTLLFGVTIVPFFWLLGPSYFALKLAALLFAACTFGLWYLFMLRFFGRRAAAIMGLVMCFAPPGFINLSLYSWGNAVQYGAFDIALLFTFCAFLAQRPGNPGAQVRAQRFHLSLFGLVAGLSAFFYYFSFCTIAVCLLVWACERKRLMSPINLAIFCVSFLIGFSPWIAVNIGSSFDGIRAFSALVHEPSRTQGPPVRVLAHSARAFVFYAYISRYWFSHGIPRICASLYRDAFAVLAAVSLARLLWTVRRAFRALCRDARPGATPHAPPPLEVILIPLAACTLCFPAMLVLLGFDRRVAGPPEEFSNFRYFTVYYAYLLCAISLLLAKLVERGTRPAQGLAILLVGFIALSSIHPCLAMIAKGRGGYGFDLQGYSDYLLGWRVAQKPAYWNDMNRGLRLSRRIPLARDRQDYLHGFAEIKWCDAIVGEEDEGIDSFEKLDDATRRATEENMSRLRTKIMSAEESYLPFFYTSLGRILCLRYLYEKPAMASRCFALMEIATSDPRRSRYRWYNPWRYLYALYLRFTAPDFRSFFYEGVGDTAGSIEAFGKGRMQAAQQYIPRRYRDDFARGAAAGKAYPYIQAAQSVPLQHAYP